MIFSFGSFAFLILLPLVRQKAAPLEQEGPMSRLAPGPNVALTAAPFVAFEFAAWNLLFTQIAVFVTASILVHYAMAGPHGASDTRGRWTAAAVLSALVLILSTFLTLGPRMVRHYDDAEYKELFILLAFALYAIETLGKLRQGIPAPPRGPRASTRERDLDPTRIAPISG